MQQAVEDLLSAIIRFFSWASVFGIVILLVIQTNTEILLGQQNSMTISLIIVCTSVTSIFILKRNALFNRAIDNPRNLRYSSRNENFFSAIIILIAGILATYAWRTQELAAPDSVDGILGVIVGSPLLDLITSLLLFVLGVGTISYGVSFIVKSAYSKPFFEYDEPLLKWNHDHEEDSTNRERQNLIKTSIKPGGLLDEKSQAYCREISSVIQEQYRCIINELILKNRGKNKQIKFKVQRKIVIDKLYKHFQETFYWPISTENLPSQIEKDFAEFVIDHFEAEIKDAYVLEMIRILVTTNDAENKVIRTNFPRHLLRNLILILDSADGKMRNCFDNSVAIRASLIKEHQALFLVKCRMVSFLIYALDKFGKEDPQGLQNPEIRFDANILITLVQDMEKFIFSGSGRLQKGIENEELQDGIDFNIREGFTNNEFDIVLTECIDYIGRIQRSITFPNIDKLTEIDNSESEFWIGLSKKFGITGGD